MFLLIFTLVVGWFILYNFYWKRRNLPPGPTPLPLVGNLIEYSKNEPGYQAFLNWKKIFGPVFTFWLGEHPFVIVTDYKLLKDSFLKNGDVFANKFNFEKMIEFYRGGEYGVLHSNGEIWKDLRRFTLHTLRDFGLGKNIMEERILLEVDEMTKSLMNHQEAIPTFLDNIDVAVGSIINQLLFGYRFDETNVDEFLLIKHLLTEQMAIFGTPQLLLIMTFPTLRFIPPFSGTFKEIMRGRDEFFNLFRTQIRKHEQEIELRDHKEEPSDFVEAFIRERKIREEEGDTESFNDIQLQNMCFDLWIAGMETTSNTIGWGVVYLLNYPEVQVKMHKELDSIIGSDRAITMSDKNSLPYLNAVINEIQRLANLLPLNLQHTVNKDYDLNGYTIKNGTGIIAQISSVLYDEEIFPEPMNFNPDRFIDDEGKLKKTEELIPFSIGKRQCLGEGLARMELFLIIANLFNRFEFLPDGAPPKMTKRFGTTVSPPQTNCKVQYRL